MRQNKYEYDAFISHAVEDKIPIANELCAKLERAGLKIWYSGKELGIGDSIEKTIQKGLNRSRYGIVIFSPTYLAKNWTIREFYTLLAKEIEEHKVILPVLYNISLNDLKDKDLVMADRFAVNSDRGIDFVVERLVKEIKKSHDVKTKQAWFTKLWFVLLLSLLANVSFLLKGVLFHEPIPELIPDQSFATIDSQRAPVNQHAFFGEIQSLFSLLNTCGCNHRAKPAQKTALVQNNDAQLQGNRNYYKQDQEAEMPALHPCPGRKMTMAVVFQIETEANSPPELREEMDQMLNTVSLSEQKDPFLKVTNREKVENENKRGCVHTASFGD